MVKSNRIVGELQQLLQPATPPSKYKTSVSIKIEDKWTHLGEIGTQNCTATKTEKHICFSRL